MSYRKKEGPKGVELELEFDYFSLGKRDLGDWDWKSQTRNGNETEIWPKQRLGNWVIYPFTHLLLENPFIIGLMLKKPSFFNHLGR